MLMEPYGYFKCGNSAVMFGNHLFHLHSIQLHSVLLNIVHCVARGLVYVLYMKLFGEFTHVIELNVNEIGDSHKVPSAFTLA